MGYINKMIMTKGEFVDRISILLHKAQKIGEKSYPEFVKFAEELLLEVPEEELLIMIKGIRNSYNINGKIWKLESDIRLNKEKELGLEEVGRRAIEIRNINNERIQAQNDINKVLGGFENPNIKYWEELKKKEKKK